MSANNHGGARADVEIPSMLDLVRLSRRPLFPPGGIDICRQIALLHPCEKGYLTADIGAAGRKQRSAAQVDQVEHGRNFHVDAGATIGVGGQEGI